MGLPVLTRIIDPTNKKWTCDWSDLTPWIDYNNNTYFISANVHNDALIGAYFTGPAGGSPSKCWDRTKPITARLRFKRFGSTWAGFSLYAGESEYVGFSINSAGTVQFYCNAAYYTPSNSFIATNGRAIELQIEFDGVQTYIFKARDFDPTDIAAWTLIGTKTFRPQVHPTIQVNQEGASGTAWFGQLDVTGSEVWQTTDLPNRSYWLPVATNYCLEWGIEYELTNGSDRGVQHFLTHAGGHTITALTDRYSNGGTASWDQGNLSTVYTTGIFSYQSTVLNPASKAKYSKLELIGGLRSGGVGASLSVSIRKADGSLVPSLDIAGAANPVVFTSQLAEIKTVDLSGLSYTGIYLEIDGNSPNSTTHTSPKYVGTEGLTGPPILKQVSVTFQPEFVTTLFFDQQPASSLNVINYSTFNQGVIQDQQIQSSLSNGLVYINTTVQSRQSQSQSSEALLSYSGIVLSNQGEQSENISASKVLTGVVTSTQSKQASNSVVREIYSGFLNNFQSKQSSTQSGIESFYGPNVGNQTKQSIAAIGSSGVTTLTFNQQPTSTEGIIYYSTEDLTVVDYQADVIQLTKVQQQIANGALGLSGVVFQNQYNKQDVNVSQLFTSAVSSTSFKNTQISLAELSFKGDLTQSSKLNAQNIIVDSDTKAILQEQLNQQQVTNASLIFEGYVTAQQLFQSQLSEKIVTLDKYMVTVYDPLQLQVTSAELLQTKVTATDPLKLLII